MSDNQTQYEKLQNEQTTVTLEDVLAQPKNKSRAKPREVIPDGKEPEKKPTTVKRAEQLKGKDVEEMFEKGSKAFVFMGAAPFWYIKGEEVHEFSDDMADLLNRIPAHYVTGVFNFSGYLTVAFGLVHVLKPRIAMQREISNRPKNESKSDSEGLFKAA